MLPARQLTFMIAAGISPGRRMQGLLPLPSGLVGFPAVHAIQVDCLVPARAHIAARRGCWSVGVAQLACLRQGLWRAAWLAVRLRVAKLVEQKGGCLGVPLHSSKHVLHPIVMLSDQCAASALGSPAGEQAQEDKQSAIPSYITSLSVPPVALL